VSKRKLRHEDYTVGWICPSEVEQVATLEMLDEEHERLPQQGTDRNVYFLGSISRHNVVIAGLPQPGNNPTATVVTRMRMAFPNLRFGLLAGIGGGVATKTGNGMIRLGETVWSSTIYPRKAEVGQFRLAGSLASPPALLLNAAQDLAAKQARPCIHSRSYSSRMGTLGGSPATYWEASPLVSYEGKLRRLAVAVGLYN
jgi:hypothetical protein